MSFISPLLSLFSSPFLIPPPLSQATLTTDLPAVVFATSVVTDADIFIFGGILENGKCCNKFWKGSLEGLKEEEGEEEGGGGKKVIGFREMKVKKGKAPSPRCGHTATLFVFF